MLDSTSSRRRLLQGGAGLVVAATSAGVVRAQDATPELEADATPGVEVEATPEETIAVPVASPVAVEPGSMTAVRPYLIATDPATLDILPILTAGEMVGDYQMAGVPDGLGAYKADDGVVLFVNHELTPEEDENMSFARVSRLVLDASSGAVMSGAYVLDGTEGYERLCSASLAGPEVGFESPTFLTGEESSAGKFGGISVAIDGASGTVTQLPWLGHISHENQVVVPGFTGKTVVVTTDDDSSGSQLYLYAADNAEGVLSGTGQLHVFVADEAANTADIKKGAELNGAFVPIDEADNADQETLTAASDAVNAFRFVRLEDVTFDRTNTTTIYFADTGDDKDPNLDASGTPFTLNGRIYAMTLDPADPTKVSAFKVLLDGDDGDDIKNPDNVEADATTLMICEDRNGYNRTENSEDTGRIHAYDLASGTLTAIAKLDQSDGDGLVDAGDKAGSWESSGILNVSDIYGEGAWLVVVQAHSIRAAQFGGEDESGQLLLLRQT